MIQGLDRAAAQPAADRSKLDFPLPSPSRPERLVQRRNTASKFVVRNADMHRLLVASLQAAAGAAIVTSTVR
jgi:hypothetical protein